MKTWIRIDEEALDQLFEEFRLKNDWVEYGTAADFVRLLKERNVNRDRT